MRNKKATIYGLFGDNGECFYVGRTLCPDRRKNQHILGNTTHGNPFIFKEIKTCSNAKAGAAEHRLIKHYKSLGQAKFNRLKAMNEKDMAILIKAGKRFSVPDGRTRLMALSCARYMGIKIITRKNDGTDSFNVVFLDGNNSKPTKK